MPIYNYNNVIKSMLTLTILMNYLFIVLKCTNTQNFGLILDDEMTQINVTFTIGMFKASD